MRTNNCYLMAAIQALRVLLLTLAIHYVAITGFCASLSSRCLLFFGSWWIFILIYKFIKRHKLFHMLKSQNLLTNLIVIYVVFCGLLYYYGNGGVWQLPKIVGSSILSLLLVLSQNYNLYRFTDSQNHS